MSEYTDQYAGDPSVPRGLGDNSAAFGIDHADLSTLLNPAVLRDQLDIDFGAFLVRRDQLLAGVDRFWKRLKKIENDDDAAAATDFGGQLKALRTDVEATRVREVKLYRDVLAAYQAWFKAGITDPIDTEADKIDAKITVYGREKAARQRAALELERKAAAAAAAEARIKAEASERASDMQTAAVAQKAAEKIETKAANATTASLSRVRGDLGTVASLRTKWGYEVVDEAQVPRAWLMLDAGKIESAIDGGLRDGETLPAIPGLRIVDRSTMKVRA